MNKQGEATKKQGLARDAASRAMQRLGGSGKSSFTVAGGGGGFADANAEAEDAEAEADARTEAKPRARVAEVAGRVAPAFQRS